MGRVVYIKGVKEWQAHYKKIQDRMAGKMGDPLRKAVAYGLSRVIAPTRRRLTGGNPLHVRTGRLRASILVDTERKGKKVRGTIGTDVWYAAIHEFGGRDERGHRVRKRPFLGPSFREKKKYIRQDIVDALRKINGK